MTDHAEIKLRPNLGRAPMQIAKARLQKSISAWQSAIPRLRHDPEDLREHREWIAEGKDQLAQLELWLATPLEPDVFVAQVREYDAQYKTNLHAQIFEHAPLIV